MFIGILLSAVDTTIAILALPTITDDLKAPFIDTIWVIITYLIVLAALTTQKGRIGDLIGMGHIYNIGDAAESKSCITTFYYVRHKMAYTNEFKLEKKAIT